MRWLLLLFIVVPLVELYLLLALGSAIGLWPTVGMVLLTGAVGSVLAKREGLRVYRSCKDALAQGKLPDEGLVSGLLVLVGGVLLVAPGTLTDIVGLLLLIPYTRRFVVRRIRAVIDKKLENTFRVVQFGPSMGVQRPAGPSRRRYDDVVDTEGVEVQNVNLLGSRDKNSTLN